MKSIEIRENPYLLKCDYWGEGEWEVPILASTKLNGEGLNFLGCDHILKTEKARFDRTIHFFKDDNKFQSYYYNPEIYVERLAQYRAVVTPDFSLYPEMPLAVQLYGIFMNRWCGAFWQDRGLTVIPSVSWGDKRSFKFCFLGLEKGTDVVVSTVSLRKEKKEKEFMAGYKELIKHVEPEHVYCFGAPFDGMGQKVIQVVYQWREDNSNGRKRKTGRHIA